MDGVGGGHYHGSRRGEGEADDAGAGDKQLRAPLWIDAHDALAPGDGGGDVKPALLIESHALRAAETAVEGFHLAGKANYRTSKPMRASAASCSISATRANHSMQ